MLRCASAKYRVGALSQSQRSDRRARLRAAAFMVEDAVGAGRLQRLLPGWNCPPLALQLAYSSRRNQPLAVRKLIEHLVDTLATDETADVPVFSSLSLPPPRSHLEAALAA
jgi:hypothetical protein